tara:strand:+ start:235 stop:381 length:147 start_codon:yes stop_codon:yes gene_type:complete
MLGLDLSITIFIVTFALMALYIFNEARPKGSKFFSNISEILRRFFRRR